jgi:hypothetical protein
MTLAMSRRHLWPTVLPLLALASSFVPSVAAAAPPPAGTERVIDVRVEVSLNAELDADFAQKVDKELVAQLEAHEIEPKDDAPTSIVAVVGWAAGSRTDIELRLLLTTSDGAPEKLNQLVCGSCGTSELVAQIGGALAKSWPKLQAASERAVGDSVAAVEPVPSAAPPPSPASGKAKKEPRKRHSIGGLGLAGAAVGAIGVGAVTAGAVMVLVQYRYPEDNPDIRKNLRTPGYGVLAVGAAASIGGIVMMAIDLTRPRRSGKVNASAAIAPRQAGLVIWGRW